MVYYAKHDNHGRLYRLQRPRHDYVTDLYICSSWGTTRWGVNLKRRIMDYKIFLNGDLKAAFEEETDRDICLDALKDYWGETDSQVFTTEAD